MMKSAIKKATVLFLAAVMIAGISGSVWAASVTSAQAVRRALKDAKLKKSRIYSLEVEYDREDGEYEVGFRRKSDCSEYDYTISAGTGRVLEAEVEFKHRVNSSRGKVGKRAAMKKAARYAGCRTATVRRGSCRYRRDGREWVYQIRFKSGHYLYDIEVLAPTGKIIEAERSLRL